MKGGTETAEEEIGGGKEGTLGRGPSCWESTGEFRQRAYSAWIRRKAALVLREERWKNRSVEGMRCLLVTPGQCGPPALVQICKSELQRW